jgi:DNA-binding response OmpR family regulator
MKKHKISRKDESAKAALQCQTHQAHRILVVEDEPDIRQLDSEVLIKSGYQVDTAENGVAAMQTLNADHYDLVIVEEEMAMMPGLELVKEMRSEEIMVPVILVLGTMPKEELKMNPWPQIQATLLKPYTVTELFRTVKEVLLAVGTDTYFRFAPPSNWQSPVCIRWVSALML